MPGAVVRRRGWVRRRAPYPRATVHECAVWIRNERLPLYLHERAGDDPIKWSTGSSLLADKPNVDDANARPVPAIDFVEFLAALDTDIALLKMDIEGAEPVVLERLFNHDVARRIKRAFVEVHDAKIPELRAATAAVKALARRRGLSGFNFDWH